jgi:hypothetical protein
VRGSEQHPNAHVAACVLTYTIAAGGVCRVEFVCRVEQRGFFVGGGCALVCTLTRPLKPPTVLPLRLLSYPPHLLLLRQRRMQIVHLAHDSRRVVLCRHPDLSQYAIQPALEPRHLHVMGMHSSVRLITSKKAYTHRAQLGARHSPRRIESIPRAPSQYNHRPVLAIALLNVRASKSTHLTQQLSLSRSTVTTGSGCELLA